MSASLILALALLVQPETTSLAEEMKVDASIPTQPGLAIVGADPGGLTQVANVSDLGTQLGTYLDEDGRLQPGFALGGRPYWWADNDITLEDYARAGRGTRILARTAVSLAGVGSGDDGSRLGIGVFTQLLDQQDPRLDGELATCLQLVAALENWQRLPEDRRAITPRPDARPESECRQEAGERFNNQPGWTIGLGAAFAGSDGQFSDLESDGFSAWSAYRNPLGAGPGDLSARLVVTADQALSVEGGTADGDEASFALVYAEEQDGRRWEVVADYTMRQYEDDLGPLNTPLDDDEFFTFGARYLARVREGVWVELGYRTSPDTETDDEDRVTVQIKLDLQD